MNNLLKNIRRVRRRMAVQRFLGLLGWCWFAAMLGAVTAIAAARIFPLGVADWLWLAGFLAAGLVVAGGWASFGRASAIEAALEIDHRFALRERVSSTLAMSAADRETEAGQALVADAEARLRRIAVLESFPLRLPRYLLLPLLPALLAVAVMLFRPAAQASPAAAAETEATQPPEVRRSADDLRKKLVERHTEAEKAGLKKTADLLARLEEGAKQVATMTNRDEALVKLNDLGRELHDRRRQLGGDVLTQQLENVGNVGRGPAEDLVKAIANGEFEKAARALEELEKKLAVSKLDGNHLDGAGKAELAQQLQQLKDKIDQLAQQAKDAQSDLEKRADPMKSVDAAVARKLEDEIQKLKEQGPQMENLQSLASKLGQCSQQIEQGQSSEASHAMQDALRQLGEMARRQSELETLDGAMEQLAEAKRQMNGEKRDGEGVFADRDEEQVGVPGRRPGKERGSLTQSSSPKSSAAIFDSRVPQSVGQGPGEVTGMTGGANLKNQAEATIQKAADEAERGTTDPLSGLHLPKKRAEHVREYFDSVREGK